VTSQEHRHLHANIVALLEKTVDTTDLELESAIAIFINIPTNLYLLRMTFEALWPNPEGHRDRLK
jgi:hypothetical protein